MKRGRGGERRAILLALLVAAGGSLALAACVAYLSIREDAAAPLQLLLPAGFLLLVLAGFWVAITLLDQHFDDLERLRGALLVAAGSTADDRGLQAAARDAGAEAVGLAAAMARLIERRGPARDAAVVLADRLSAVVAAASEGLLVLTDSGLVSLVNAAARRRLEPGRVAVGTSIFAALERAPLLSAQQAARAAGRPQPATLTTVEGEPLEAVVADLGGCNGLVLCLAGGPLPDDTRPHVEQDLGLHDSVPPMSAVEDATPLDSLSALVLDSETTGLDVASARVVSLGAVRVQGRRIYAQANLDCLVKPDLPIPAASTAIHGISDALVADAPPIGELLPRLGELIGPGALVGHNIGYDLTILAAEAARCGRPWQAPPALDIALLTAALEPGLNELNLEDIAARLGVPVEGRHTALGDALVTAEIFVRLLPRLEDAGVRTFGEAQAFAARARGLLGLQRAAGWTH